MTHNKTNDICHKDNNYLSIVVGTIIILSIVLTYLPQYLKIIRGRTTVGISYLYLLLGNISNFTNFFGSLLLNYGLVDCCTKISAGKCINILLPIYQLFTPWLCIFILYIIFLIYDNRENARQYKLAFINFTLFILIFVFILGIIGLMLINHYNRLKKNIHTFGDILNIVSTVTCFLTFFPQILKTYKIKTIGSLSLISLTFQSIGSFIVFIYQFTIVKTSLSIGIPYLVSGILQLSLLSLGTYYNKRNKEYPKLIVNYESDVL